jgi:hypothetical protein
VANKEEVVKVLVELSTLLLDKQRKIQIAVEDGYQQKDETIQYLTLQIRTLQ